MTSGSAKTSSSNYVEFTLYITTDGKLSFENTNPATATDEVVPSVGLEKRIYVAVDGNQPTDGAANKDTSVTVTLSAAVQ